MNRNEGSSLLVHGLFIRRPILNLFLRCWNFLCFPSSSSPLPLNPKKILLTNIAHFGDVVISTVVLPALKRRFPDTELHFLTSSLTKCVVEDHPLVAKIFTFDHWAFAKEKRGLCKAALHSWYQSFHLQRKLKKEQYDLAIDLYSYFPNAIRLLTASNIPVRIGYTSGGFGRKFTHPNPWTGWNQYMAKSQLQLLAPLGIDSTKERPLPYLGKQNESHSSYAVVHMGSSKEVKEWDKQKWIEMIQCLKRPVILTGYGKREADLCNDVASITRCKNRCNQLQWSDFVSTIRSASLLISVDSAAVHVAAAYEIPTVALYTGINLLQMWLPPHPRCIGLTTKVSCSPCFQKNGCKAMSCIREIQVDEVLRAIESVTDQPGSMYPFLINSSS